MQLSLKAFWFLFSSLVFLTACEPESPSSLTHVIPEHSRSFKNENWRIKTSTLNVWGLPVISKDQDVRMPAIGKAIKSRNLDIALFQEAWTSNVRNTISQNSAKSFRLDVVFNISPIESGLMFLSNTPYQRTAFRAFQLFGPLILPDAWAIKGIGMVTTEVKGLPVSFFSTHLMAGIDRSGNKLSPLTPEWKAEMFEVMAHIIEQTDSDAFVLAGDFNIHFGNEEYDFWKRLSSLEGTLLQERNGDCTWCKDNFYAEEGAKQLDYIFVSPRLKILETKVDYKERVYINGYAKNLSDHYGVTAALGLNNNENPIDSKIAKKHFESELKSLRNELEIYLEQILPFEKEIRKQVQEKLLDPKFCQSCRIEKTLLMIDNYDAALDRLPAFLNKEQKTLKLRLESYFNIFD